MNARRDSIHIAIDVINDGLKYIFFSDNRMQIQVSDGVYKLFSNGHAVKPKDISVGERNIIGLCYFFTSILQGKNKEAAYSEEYLLIIDDPVSSYDLENKVGILSFLKYQLGKFLLGNIETRALLLTHDLLTAIDVEKMFGELITACKVYFNGQRGFSWGQYELSDYNIKRFNNNRNEYTELLKIIYEYGGGGASEQGPYIGNIMRQVMEAFATFEYKKGIDAVSTDDTILSVMEQEEDKSRQITCSLFTAKLYEMMGWEALYRYKLQGTRINYRGEQLYVFDLTSTEIFLPAVKDPDNPKARAKRSAAMYPADWRDSFGIPVQEHDDSMQVDLMEGFNFADMSGKPQEPEEDQEQIPMEIIDKETGEVIKV